MPAPVDQPAVDHQDRVGCKQRRHEMSCAHSKSSNTPASAECPLWGQKAKYSPRAFVVRNGLNSGHRADMRHVRVVPTADIRIAKKEGSSFLEPLILAGATAVQLARARGLTVIGTAGTERGRKLVLSEGAHHVLDHTARGYLDECVRLSEPRPRTNVEEQVLRHDTEIEP
jgi:hypothetical protein